MRRASPADGPREVSQGKPASEAAMTIRARCRSAMNGEATTMSTEFRSPPKPVMSSDGQQTLAWRAKQLRRSLVLAAGPKRPD